MSVNAVGNVARYDGMPGDDKAKSLPEVWATVWQGPLWGLFLVLGLEIFGGSVSIPVFSFFCIHELGLHAAAVGTLLSAFNLAQSLGGPIVGRISDALGRRGILLLCFAWSSCCFAATSQVGGFYDLLAVRMLAGLSGGSIPVAAAMVMDCAAPLERPAILGCKGAVLGAAFTTGPALAVHLLWLGFPRRQVLLVAAAFCLLGFFVGSAVLRESLSEGKRRPLGSGGAAVWAGGGAAAGGLAEDWSRVRVELVGAWVARFFHAFCMFSLFATYSFLIKDNFGWSDRQFGILLGASGVLQGLLELLAYPTASARLGEHWVCVLGAIATATGVFLLPSRRLWLHLLAFSICQVGQALCNPGLVNLTGLHAPSERHMGFAQGVSNGFRAAASVVAPLAAGRLYDTAPFWTYALASGAAAASAGSVALGVHLGREQRAEARPLKGEPWLRP